MVPSNAMPTAAEVPGHVAQPRGGCSIARQDVGGRNRCDQGQVYRACYELPVLTSTQLLLVVFQDI
jgi:hypothetical protein